MCITNKQEKSKLDSRCEQGVFIRWAVFIIANLVYYPDTERFQKHKLKTTKERETQKSESHTVYGDVHTRVDNSEENVVDENV